MTPGQGQIFRLGVQPAGIARAAFAASSGLRCAAMLCLLRQLCSGAGHDVGLEPLDG